MSVWKDTLPSNTPYNRDIGFQPLTVTIDNFSGYFLYVPDANTFIPPFWVGRVINLPHSTTRQQILIQSPYGNDQLPLITGGQVNVTYTDFYLPENQGIQILPSTNVISLYQSGFAHTGVNNIPSLTLPLPPVPGNVQVAWASKRNGALSPLTLSGAGWRLIKRVSTTAGDDWPNELSYRVVPLGASQTVTLTTDPPAGNPASLVIAEFTGVGFLDQFTFIDQGPVSVNITGTLTPTRGREVLLVSGVNMRSDQGPTFTPTGDMIELADGATNGITGPCVAFNYQIVTIADGNYAVGSIASTTFGASGTDMVAAVFLGAGISLETVVDVSDRSARLLGHVTVDNASIPVTFAGGIDVTDRAARLVGHVTVDNASIPVTFAGGIDVTDRAARLVGHVTVDNAVDVTDRVGRLVGHVTVDNASISVTQGTSPWVVSLTSTTITGTVDISDRSARLLGHVTVDNASISVTQGTSPWVVSLTSTTITGTVAVTSSQTTPADALANTAGLPVVAENEGFNGTTWDRLRSGADNADAIAVVTTGIQRNAAENYGFNGTTWDRIRSGADNADAIAVVTTGIQRNAAEIYGFNGTTWDRLRSGADNADAIAVVTTGIQRNAAETYGFNGTTWDRLRSGGDNADAIAGIGTGILRSAAELYLFNGSQWERARTIADIGGRTGTLKVGQSRLQTYAVNGRLTTRVYQLSHVFAGAGRFQYLTIFHAAGATKSVRIKLAAFSLVSVSAVATMAFDLSRLTAATTPATGNPAMTPQAANAANTAEATVLALPTTQGTEASATSVFSSALSSYGITGGSSAISPPPIPGQIILWPFASNIIEVDDPLMRSGNAEGWAIVVDVSAAVTITGVVELIFTEE